MRDSATVLGYREAGSLVELRRHQRMICLADNPADSTFHVACYHESLEPFMARGRALRASGVTGEQVDTVRFREIRAGTLTMPAGRGPAFAQRAGRILERGLEHRHRRARAVRGVHPLRDPASTGIPASGAQSAC